MLCICRLLLRNDLSRVELDKHGAVCFQFFHGHTQPKVVEKKELELEVIELGQWQAANLEIVLATSWEDCRSKAYLGIS